MNFPSNFCTKKERDHIAFIQQFYQKSHNIHLNEYNHSSPFCIFLPLDYLFDYLAGFDKN